MSFDTVKALHIIFVVSWFAGLFYMVRLFIYHVEAKDKGAEESRILTTQYKIMEKKLWYIITYPAMILTLIFGTWMLILVPAYLFLPWMQLKLIFVLLLLIYHGICHRIFIQLKIDQFKWSSNGLRIWNEVATLLLVIIVFIVVLKHNLNWIWATIGFFAVAIALMMGIKLYKRLSNKK